MRLIILLASACILFSSCKTYQSIVPTISGDPRRNLNLENPIILSFKDSRPNKEKSLVVKENLRSDLKKIYGENVTFQSYYDKTPNNYICIKINIKEVGAKFGVRTIEFNTYKTRITTVSSEVSSYWGDAVSTTIISQPVIQKNYSAEGYWVGTSYLQIKLVDKFHQQNKIFNFPFAAENKKSNVQGYRSGKVAAKKSWERVSSNLLELIDSIAMRMIESK
jgi:hypothetical protein